MVRELCKASILNELVVLNVGVLFKLVQWVVVRLLFCCKAKTAAATRETRTFALKLIKMRKILMFRRLRRYFKNMKERDSFMNLKHLIILYWL